VEYKIKQNMVAFGINELNSPAIYFDLKFRVIGGNGGSEIFNYCTF
jgi:hypothetical protein